MEKSLGEELSASALDFGEDNQIAISSHLNKISTEWEIEVSKRSRLGNVEIPVFNNVFFVPNDVQKIFTIVFGVEK